MAMSTSLRTKVASPEQYRMSQAATSSTTPPTQAPCTAAMTGFRQSSTAVSAACKSRIPRRSPSAAAAGSAPRPGTASGLPGAPSSMPAQKWGPEAESTTARAAGRRSRRDMARGIPRTNHTAVSISLTPASTLCPPLRRPPPSRWAPPATAPPPAPILTRSASSRSSSDAGRRTSSSTWNPGALGAASRAN